MDFHRLLYYGMKAHSNKWRIRKKICKIILRVRYQCEVALEADIGENVHFCHSGFGIVVNARSKIGGGTCIQHCVTIGDLETNGPVPIIGSNCFIGARAILLGGVHVGDNAKVGAGAVVLEDVPDNCTVVGIPARIVRENGA